MCGKLNDLIDQMQAAETASDADRIRLALEAEFVPNQVLQGDVVSLVRHVAEGLPRASAPGRLESWGLLAQIAASAVPPTAADRVLVSTVQEELFRIVPLVIEVIRDPSDRGSAIFGIDIIDSLLEIGSLEFRKNAYEILIEFSRRGDSEARMVQPILADLMD